MNYMSQKWHFLTISYNVI